MWLSRCTNTRRPLRARRRSARWLASVPLGRKTAVSFPSIVAIRSSSCVTMPSRENSSATILSFSASRASRRAYSAGDSAKPSDRKWMLWFSALCGSLPRAATLTSPNRMRKKSVLAKPCVEQRDATHATVAKSSSANRFARRFWRFLPRLGTFRAWLRNSLHQLGQPDQVVGSGRQREHPADAGQATVMGLAKAGGRLGPAKHLLNALAHLPTDRIARVTGRPTIDGRSPIGGVLRHMRRHVVRAQIGDKLGHIIGLIGTERDPMIAGVVRHHLERGLAFRRPGGQSQTRVDHQSMPVLH